MNIQIKGTARLLLDPKSMIFGVAVFNLCLVWLRSPEWSFHRNVFMAVLLIVSAILLLVNTSWSNLIAAILSGYLPIEFLYGFWMFAHYAEVPVLSYRHFSSFLRVEIESEVLLFVVLTLMIWARAVIAVMSSIPARSTSHADG